METLINLTDFQQHGRSQLTAILYQKHISGEWIWIWITHPDNNIRAQDALSIKSYLMKTETQ